MPIIVDNEPAKIGPYILAGVVASGTNRQTKKEYKTSSIVGVEKIWKATTADAPSPAGQYLSLPVQTLENPDSSYRAPAVIA